MAQWSLDINKWCGKSNAKLSEIKRTFAFMLYSSIVKKTPVDTGRARGNWNISAGSPDTTTSDAKDPKFKNPKSVPASKGDEAIYICNNLDYIRKLEFGGYPNPPKNPNGKTVNGFSKQAPQGMVGITVANAERYLKKALDLVQND